MATKIDVHDRDRRHRASVGDVDRPKKYHARAGIGYRRGSRSARPKDMMMGQERSGPKARTDGLICEEVDGELVVYDQRSDRMTRLNHSAAVVWRACDGNRSPAELLTCAQAALGDLADEDLVALALDGLSASDLLDGEAPPVRAPRDTRESRRRFIRRAGTVGIAATLLPVVNSLVAPTPAAAATITVPGCGSCVTIPFSGGG
jgi:hypothetical protein